MHARRQTIVSALLIAAVFCTWHIAAYFLPDVFAILRYRAADSLFTIRAEYENLRPEYDQSIVHVPITDLSRELSQNFYLDRTDHARIVKTLGQLGVAAQFHDIIFSRPKNASNDAVLEDSIRKSPSVYFGMALGVDRVRTDTSTDSLPASVAIQLKLQRWEPIILGDVTSVPPIANAHLTMPQFAEASSGLGFIDITPDQDGVIRRAPLLARDDEAIYPNLALRVISDYLGVDPATIVVRPGRSVTLTAAIRPEWETPRDITIPIDRYNRMLINYVGPWGTMNHYPYEVIVEAAGDRFFREDLSEELRGKIVVISWVATGAGDIGSVPVDSAFPLSGVHANTMHTILTEDFLREFTTLEMLVPFYLPLLGLLLLASVRLSTPWLTVVSVFLAILYYILAHLIFRYANVVVDIPGPLSALVGSTILLAAYQFHLESKSKAVLRNTFDAYFPPQVVEKVMSQRENLISSANKKEITILFSDIKDFTRLTADIDASKVRALLNEYFEQMIEIVFHHEGTLDKFIGDGMMVFFGDPEEQSDHATRCVKAALDMQKAARILNAKWQAIGDMPLQIRVGINTGVVIVGNMGSNRRLTYTALGEPVNLAARMESNAPVGGILITKRTFELLDDSVKTIDHEPVAAKGYADPIEAFEIPVV